MTTALVHAYAPAGNNRKLFETRAEELVLSGPAGSGKTVACLEKLNACALKYPGMRGLIVRKTASSLGSTSLVTWREKVIPELLKAGHVVYYGGSGQEAAQYRYANGSSITLGGMDKSSKIMSSEYDMVYVNEAIELTDADWEAIISRLRNGRMPYQQLMADTNPDTPTHWLKQRCDRGDTLLIDTRHEDNPALYDRERNVWTPAGQAYMRRLDRLTGVRHQRLRRGLWVAAEGVIYEDWDSSVHLIDRFRIPPGWQRWWAVDFGYVNPFVAQAWAEDPDGRLFLEWEVYRTRRTVDEHAKAIMQRVSKAEKGYVHPDGEPRRAYHGRVWTSPRPTAVITDHDAEGRVVLERELGLSTVPAHKAVKEGIEAVQRRLRDRRLFIFRDALVEKPDPELMEAFKPVQTHEELVGYVWDTKKDQPIKEDDHGADCVRYLCAYRDLKSRSGVRFI